MYIDMYSVHVTDHVCKYQTIIFKMKLSSSFQPLKPKQQTKCFYLHYLQQDIKCSYSQAFILGFLTGVTINYYLLHVHVYLSYMYY